MPGEQREQNLLLNAPHSMLMNAECEGVVKIHLHTHICFSFASHKAVSRGVARYTNLWASYISLKQGWVEARPQQ